MYVYWFPLFSSSTKHIIEYTILFHYAGWCYAVWLSSLSSLLTQYWVFSLYHKARLDLKTPNNDSHKGCSLTKTLPQPVVLLLIAQGNWRMPDTSRTAGQLQGWLYWTRKPTHSTLRFSSCLNQDCHSSITQYISNTMTDRIAVIISNSYFFTTVFSACMTRHSASHTV